jgi:diguanylate cyclase (GGDEF)-like protein
LNSTRINGDVGMSPKEAFVIDVLNALTASIAVLDDEGTIIAANVAWKRFSNDNGGSDSAAFVGSNYLAACEAAMRAGDATAQAVHAAFHELQSGERKEFAIEYPCHSPQMQRWFEMRMTRSAHEPHYIVVAHEDITSRKAMEAELLRAKQSIESSNAQLRESLAREQENVRTDELTGIHNRRHCLALARQAFAVASRYRRPLGMILLDVDHFKQINDQWGHQIGDDALKHVAMISRRHLRSADILGRYGGEEFIVFLPDSTAGQARIVAERIREDIERTPLVSAKGAIRLTVSAGISDTAQSGTHSIERLIGLADDALYAAKQEGRNRISSGPGSTD